MLACPTLDVIITLQNGHSVSYGRQANGQPYINLNGQQPVTTAQPNDYMNTAASAGGDAPPPLSNGDAHSYTNTGPAAAAALLGKNGW